MAHESDDDSALSPLDEIVRQGARTMLAAAVQAEVDAFVGVRFDDVHESGHQRLERDDYYDRPSVDNTAGAGGVHQPRFDDKCVDKLTGNICFADGRAWRRVAIGSRDAQKSEKWVSSAGKERRFARLRELKKCNDFAWLIRKNRVVVMDDLNSVLDERDRLQERLEYLNNQLRKQDLKPASMAKISSAPRADSAAESAPAVPTTRLEETELPAKTDLLVEEAELPAETELLAEEVPGRRKQRWPYSLSDNSNQLGVFLLAVFVVSSLFVTFLPLTFSAVGMGFLGLTILLLVVSADSLARSKQRRRLVGHNRQQPV